MFSDNRLDSEYVLKFYLIADNTLDKTGSQRIGDFAYVTDGIHESIDFDESSDINLISAKAPKCNTFDLSRTGHISRMQDSVNLRTQLKENDIILSTVGTIGNCAVVNKRILPANADRHVGIIRITPQGQIKPRFLSTFILTKYGRSQTKRFTTGNVQPNLFIYKVKDIKVPILSVEFQDAIEQTILNSENLIYVSETIMQDSVNMLEEYLGIANCHFENSNAVKSLSDSFKQSGRLDAEYYQPKYEEYEKVVKNSSNGYAPIKDKFVCVTDKCKRNLSKYRYIEIGDINVDNGDYSYNIINADDLPDNAKIMTKAGDILVSTVRPNRGAVAILEENDLLVSGAFTVLRQISDYSSEILQVLLRSFIYRDWLLKFNVGTSYPVIKDIDVLNMPIPILDTDKQKEISDKVQQSFRLRREAKRLLDNAVKAVETAIETDEETALKLFAL